MGSDQTQIHKHRNTKHDKNKKLGRASHSPEVTRPNSPAAAGHHDEVRVRLPHHLPALADEAEAVEVVGHGSSGLPARASLDDLPPPRGSSSVAERIGLA